MGNDTRTPGRRICVLLDGVTDAALLEIADREDRTFSSALREAVRAGLRQRAGRARRAARRQEATR